MPKNEIMVSVRGLKKSFKDKKVLKGVSFEIEKGTILALLGPNGAGKTTTIRILSTLLRSDAGQAKIAGYDVFEDPNEVRARIGLTGQFAAVDGYLTAEENLYLMGRLYRMSTTETKKRIKTLVKQFELSGDE